MSTLRVSNIELNQAGNASISIANTYNVVVSIDGTEKAKFTSSGLEVKGNLIINNKPASTSARLYFFSGF